MPLMLSLVVALGPLAFGYTLGFTSPIGSVLENPTHDSPAGQAGLGLTSSENSLFGALVNVGCMLGALVAGVTADAIGRVRAMSIACIPWAGGFILISFATTAIEVFIGRILTGVGVGMISLAVPVYVAEISPTRLRGALGCIFQLAITLGILVVFVLGIPITNWRTLAWIGALLPGALFVATIFTPRTPRWLLSKNKTDEALKSLRILRGRDADVDIELEEIQRSIKDSQALGSARLSDLVSGTTGRAMVVAALLMLFQQFSGINAVVFNAGTIFADAGMSNPQVPALIVASVQVVVTAIACVIIDKTGRRALLLIAGIGMAGSVMVLGYYFYLLNHRSESPAMIAVAMLILYVAFFSIGLGAIPWLMMSEIFPAKARGLAASLATLLNWTFSFIVTYSFASMNSALSEQGTFWFYTGVCILGVTYVMIYVPETKGRTLEQIEAHFAGHDDGGSGGAGTGRDLVRFTGAGVFLVAGILMVIMSL